MTAPRDAKDPPPPEDYDPISEEPESPMLAAIHMKLVAWSEGAARIEGDLAPPVINRSGVAHGGALMTLMDGAAGYAGCWCPYPGRVRRCLTLSMTTQFISGGRGARLITSGRVVGGGRSLFFAEAEVRNETGALIATSTGVFRYLGDSRNLYGAAR